MGHRAIRTIGAVALLTIAGAASGEPERRAVPDYDGRPPGPPSFAEIASWPPRIVLFPAYLVSEYAVRRPLGALVTKAEKDNWPAFFIDLFTFDEERKVGLVPTVLVDFGFRTSAGVYFFWDDFLTRGNDLRAHAATGGASWYLARVADRMHFDRWRLELRGGVLTRPDYLFEGVGSAADDEARTRYGSDRVDAEIACEAPIAHAGRAEIYTGYRLARFFGVGPGGDPSLDAAVREGRVSAPAGFREGYQIQRVGGRIALDTREPWPLPGTGLRLDLELERGFDLEGSPVPGFFRYGGVAGGFLDLAGTNRIVSLSIGAEMIDPTGAGEIPFTELSTLTSLPGIDRVARMPGFLPGALIGRSTISLALEYRWPVWALADGSIHAAVGNAFDAHLRDFEPQRLRLSFGIGVTTLGTRDAGFVLLVAAGTERFEDGLEVDSIRLEIGTRRGF